MNRASLIAAALVVASMLMIPSTISAGDMVSVSIKWELTYHSVVPLGEDSILLKPGNQPLSFLASAESIHFEGWRQISSNTGPSLLTADGHPVERYPRFVDFRVTVSARRHAIPGLQPLLVDCESQCMQNVNEYLLGLQFRIKIFRELHFTVLEPKAVKLIGIPGDVSYDERIYRISFDLGEVPVANRIVLEVLSPAGDRLTRFHLDM